MSPVGYHTNRTLPTHPPEPVMRLTLAVASLVASVGLLIALLVATA